MFRTLPITVACVVALSACQTASLDAAISRTLPQVCSAAATAHSAFVIASPGNVKPSTVAKEAAAWKGIAILCTDPGKATAADAIVRVAQAYVAISAALKEAKAAD